MSVLIKGMKMPQSCHECVAGYGGCCFVAPAEADGICPDNGRADFCPLIPIPPHGRLIDADALRAEVKKHATPSDAWVFSLIRTAPTIIPGEEGNKNG